jgi:DNA-binding CsgD family transcriptional regulator
MTIAFYKGKLGCALMEEQGKKNGLIRHILTNQQLVVLDLLVIDELLPDEVANKLSISPRTVRFHIERINEAYGTTSMQLSVIKYCKELQIEGLLK